jgi:hypothetical protein
MRVLLAFLGIALSLAGAALALNSANADVLYNNLAASSDGNDPAATVGPLYDSFSTGSSPFNLSAIFYLVSGDPSDGGTFNVRLYSDNSGTPGGVILNFAGMNDFLLPGSAGEVSTSFVPYLLAADTRYWVSISSTDSIVWYRSLDITGPGVAGEFFANTNGVFPNSDGPYQMAIGGSVAITPLPSTWTMLIAGFLSLGFFAYRGSKKGFAALAAA